MIIIIVLLFFQEEGKPSQRILVWMSIHSKTWAHVHVKSVHFILYPLFTGIILTIYLEHDDEYTLLHSSNIPLQ